MILILNNFLWSSNGFKFVFDISNIRFSNFLTVASTLIDCVQHLSAHNISCGSVISLQGATHFHHILQSLRQRKVDLFRPIISHFVQMTNTCRQKLLPYITANKFLHCITTYVDTAPLIKLRNKQVIRLLSTLASKRAEFS